VFESSRHGIGGVGSARGWGRGSRGIRRAPLSGLLLVVFVSLGLLGWDSSAAADPDPDPGFVLEIDSAAFRVSVRDARSGERGPSVEVVLGSPAHETPHGDFPVAWVILRPSWHPSPSAQRAGAVPEPASLDSPMGVAKIPFAANGSVALHGGGDPRLMGRPVSGGCVRAGDGDLLRVIAWLDQHGALGPAREREDGEIHRPFQRPARVIVH